MSYVRGPLLKHIAASGRGIIWGLDRDRVAHHCNHECEVRDNWKLAKGDKKTQLDVGEDCVCAIDHKNNLQCRPVNGEGKWKTPKKMKQAKHVALIEKQIFVINMKNKLYLYGNSPDCKNSLEHDWLELFFHGKKVPPSFTRCEPCGSYTSFVCFDRKGNLINLEMYHLEYFRDAY